MIPSSLTNSTECVLFIELTSAEPVNLDVRYVDALRSASRKKIQCHNKSYQDHGKNWKQTCFHKMKETVITVDYLSNSWEVDRLLDTVINSKLTSHFVWNGIPNNLVSDNGAQYDKLSTLSEWQC